MGHYKVEKVTSTGKEQIVEFIQNSKKRIEEILNLPTVNEPAEGRFSKEEITLLLEDAKLLLKVLTKVQTKVYAKLINKIVYQALSNAKAPFELIEVLNLERSNGLVELLQALTNCEECEDISCEDHPRNHATMQ